MRKDLTRRPAGAVGPPAVRPVLTKADVGTLYLAILGGAELRESDVARIRAARIACTDGELAWIVETMLRSAAQEHDYHRLESALERLAGMIEGGGAQALSALQAELAQLRAALGATEGEVTRLQEALAQALKQQSAPYRPLTSPLRPELAKVAGARRRRAVRAA